MWWINLVKKLRTFKFLKLVQKIRELRVKVATLGRRRMMRRTIRGAQAGFRRFTQFQMWIIKLTDELKRAGLVVPSDLSSTSTSNNISTSTCSCSPSSMKKNRVEGGGGGRVRKDTSDELLEYGLDDDLDVISLDALSNYWDHHQHQHQRTRSHYSTARRNSKNSPRHSPRNSRNFDEDQQQELEQELDEGLEASEEIFFCESCSISGSPSSGSGSASSSPSSYSSSSSSSIFSQIMRGRKTSTSTRESPTRNSNNNSDDDYQVTKQMDKSSTFSSFPSHHHHHQKSHRHSRPRRHRRRRRHSQSHEFTEEQTSHRSAFLDFLFEDSPSPSRFLTTQALQNILRCPSCSEQTMSILPTDISSSRSCRPCDQRIEDYRDPSPAVELGIEIGSGKCLLCECSYGETKSLLLEKLAMRSWLRPCKYQKYGCKSIVGVGVQFDDLGHSEENCKFAPIHCPFMLCRRKFPKEVLLINHLRSEHHLNPHTGPKSFETEGTIFCLGNNRRLGGKNSRANYSMDPCVLYFYGNMFILRILRHGTSWYVWVWTLTGGRENSTTIDRNGNREIPAGQENCLSETETEKFSYTIRFRRQSASQPPANLVVQGTTVSVRYSMEEIMEKGLCLQIMEQGSLFDCSEEKYDNSLVVDFKLVIQPPPVPQPNHHNSSCRTNSTANNRFKSQPAAIATRYRKKSH